jgi:outer membrane protein assembly factor BamE (lipoprotein component of BamABCDE complex)
MYTLRNAKAIAVAAVCGAALLAGCEGGPLVRSAPPRNEALFERISQGMPAEQVRRTLGPPDEAMKFPLSHTEAWDYRFQDAWGYYATFSAIFDGDGRVASTYTGRLHGGDDHGK